MVLSQTKQPAGPQKDLGFYQSKTAGLDKLPVDSSLHYVSEGLALARKNKDDRSQAIMLERFAKLNHMHGYPVLALQYQQEAVHFASRATDTKLIAEMGSFLGELQASNGQFQQSRQSLAQALSSYQKIKWTPGQIRVYTALGDAHRSQKKYGLSIRYYQMAEALFVRGGEDVGRLRLLKTIGETYALNGNYRSALEYFENGMQQSRAVKDQPAWANFLQLAAAMLDTLGQKQKAIDYHQHGLQQIGPARQNPQQHAQLLISLAATVQQADAAQGLAYLKRALDLSDAAGHKDLSAAIYKSMHILYKQGQQYEQAMTALEAYHQLNDSLLLAGKQHQFAILHKSYQLLQSTAHVEGLELENQKKTTERNLYLFLVVFVIALLIVGTLYLYKVKDLNRKLSVTNSQKDKLFSIIGHDLKNPVGGITQLLTMIEDGDLSPEEQSIFIPEMRKQGQAAMDILNSLLQWGRAQLKGIQANVSDFSAGPIITKNLEVLGKQITDKSIVIEQSTEQNMTLKGDMNHFDFIVRNLLSNAIKFSPDNGSISIKAAHAVETGKAIFSVSDQGAGISKEQQEKFTFEDLDITYGTKGEKGTGIGLSLAKEFVRVNQGRIWLESMPGKGTTFYFSWQMAHP